MNKLVTVLVIAVIILVAALGYLFGERKSEHPQSLASDQASPPNPKPGPTSKLLRPTRLLQPVIVGKGGPNLDACGSNARVIGLNPNGDNFLAVKAAPRVDAPRIDKLGPNFEVYVCDESKDGRWLGIVYEPNGQPSANCGITSPVETPQPYPGRCQSGWVYSKYIDVYAG